MSLRLVLMAAAGWVLSHAFAPTGWWWLSVPAIAVFIICCHRQRPRAAFALGTVFGAAFFIPLLDWVSVVIGADAGLGLAVYSALWLGLTGAGVSLVTRLPGWWLWVPCVWGLQEAVSSRVPFGGWGWGRLGFSQDASPLTPIAAIAGVPGLSFALVLTASVASFLGMRLAARIAAARRGSRSPAVPDGAAAPPDAATPAATSASAPASPEAATSASAPASPEASAPASAEAATPAPAAAEAATPASAPAAVGAAAVARTVAAPVAAVLAVWLAALLLPVPTAAQPDGGPAYRNVALVQGNVPRSGLDFNAQRRAVLDNHVRQTMELAQAVAAGEQAVPDLVLWPENASDIDPYRNADARSQIDAAAAAIGAPILVGAVVVDPDDPSLLYNRGIVWDPATGPGAFYTKRNLVPFGEYVPFREVLARVISRFDRVPRDFVPGDLPGALDIGGTRIGDAICFDVAFDDALRDAAVDGARMLVVQTNNATYNTTSQPAQQFAMSRIRAVEHGRAVAVVSTSGLSGIIGPDGSVVPGTAIGELVPGRYVVALPQRDDLTVSDRVGAAPEWVVSAIGIAALLAAVRSRRTGSGSGAGEQGSTAGDGGRTPGASIGRDAPTGVRRRT